MGMAAGQARLLSITSRMSDNELRAQIINNNKMRLATESSQVSESYIQALNEAQMMFTSYDANNNASYQQLTFNALTAYNQYNNQYLLSNAAGNVLLSETDAENYRNANGSVTKFLAAYGLEQSTSYFDNLQQYVDENGLKFKTGTYDDEGNEKYGYLQGDVAGASSSTLVKYIQDLYEGNLGDKVLHPGYMAAVASEDYNNYNVALSDFTAKQDAYIATVYDEMQNKYNDLKGNDQSAAAIRTAIGNAASTSDMNDIFDNILNFLDAYKNYLPAKDNDESSAYIKNMRSLINDNKGDYATETINQDTEDAKRSVSSDGNTVTITIGKDDDAEKLTISRTQTPSGFKYTATAEGTDDDGNPSSKNYTTQSGVNSITLKDSSSGESITFDSNQLFNKDENAAWKIESKTKNDLDHMKQVATSVLNSLAKSIANVWDPNNAAFRNEDKTEYTSYIDAGKKLSELVFGKNINEAEYVKLTDINWIKKYLDNASNGVSTDKKNAFQKIYDVYQLDCIMDTYGEPNYTWINKNNQNENGESKAQWYENLFERIQSGGYKVLQDGLASSTEWIKFAFESGIVTMEQVDSNRNWQSMIYQNCSDITEQTDDTAVAKAEAEYKAAMNKIENKDKRYDLELKNIDTEHNSLQTEYDSIKSAIDKNIERTFKLYS